LHIEPLIKNCYAACRAPADGGSVTSRRRPPPAARRPSSPRRPPKPEDPKRSKSKIIASARRNHRGSRVRVAVALLPCRPWTAMIAPWGRQIWWPRRESCRSRRRTRRSPRPTTPARPSPATRDCFGTGHVIPRMAVSGLLFHLQLQLPPRIRAQLEQLPLLGPRRMQLRPSLLSIIPVRPTPTQQLPRQRRTMLLLRPSSIMLPTGCLLFLRDLRGTPCKGRPLVREVGVRWI